MKSKLYTEISEGQFYNMIGSAENNSEHPLAQAVCNHAREQFKLELKQPIDFKAIAGKGLQCTVDERSVLIGNRSWMQDNEIVISDKVEADIASLEVMGKTVVISAIDGLLIGIVAIADAVKPEAKVAIQYLKNQNYEVWMVTGDNSRTANAIAKELGIDNVYAEVLPKHKAEKVKEVQAKGLKVAFVGDGINDSPALAQADIGVAVASGTDIAIEAADLILMKSDLRDVVVGFDIARKTYNRIIFNFFWAFVYNSLGIPIAAGVFYPLMKTGIPPAAAGLAMALSSVSVIVSSLLLRVYFKPTIPITP